MKLIVIRNTCGDPYLIRWKLFELFGFSLKLHTILRSDDDRAPHDHPWSFWTLMLAGGYYEWTFATQRDIIRASDFDLPDDQVVILGADGKYYLRTWVRPGKIRFCKAPHPHRLECPAVPPVARPSDPNLQGEVIDGYFSEKVRPMFAPAITLVFMYPRFREWGFYTEKGWLKWRDFLTNHGQPEC